MSKAPHDSKVQAEPKLLERRLAAQGDKAERSVVAHLAGCGRRDQQPAAQRQENQGRDTPAQMAVKADH